MRSRWLYAGAAALLALSSHAALAQGHGRARGHGADRAQNRGRAQQANREAEARFGDRDRVYANNWYYHNRRSLPPGLRDSDRLPPGVERRFVPGFVIDRELRPRVYEAPVVLVRRFPPPPPGCRYVVFGGRIVLLDAGFRVRDFIRLDINLGP